MSTGDLKILACDPGTRYSGVVLYDPLRMNVIDHGKLHNRECLQFIRKYLKPDGKSDGDCIFVAEMLAGMGVKVGYEVFEAATWLGRFIEAAVYLNVRYALLKRVSVKAQFDNAKNDAMVREALIERFPSTGGGKVPQIGTKKEPGPLYGVKRDAWAALAVAVAYFDILTQLKAGLRVNVLPYQLEADVEL